MNILQRKSQFLALQAMRWRERLKPNRDGDAILANSVPKSGTHLLTQVLSSFPGIRNYLTFLASKPSWSYRERPARIIKARINAFVDREMVTGHLFFDPEFERELIRKKVVQFMVYRDPRDVVCSEAHYLSNMAKFHRLHRSFKRLGDPDEQIMFSIQGSDYARSDVPLENIRERYERYRGWIESPHVCAVKFEDLVGANQQREVRKICEHFAASVSGNCDVEALVDHALARINPENSHTYRKGGGVGNWKKRFNPEHVAAFSAVAGDLLTDLGYDEAPPAR